MRHDEPRVGLSEPDPRVFFAAERTFLAWIRTGLALMGFGFVVAPESTRSSSMSAEVYYNQRRRHSTLGQISPAEFERRAAP